VLRSEAGDRVRTGHAGADRGDMMAGKFVLKRDKAGKFRFNLVAGNGEIIASSEAYDSKAAASSGIDSVKRTAPDARVDDQSGRVRHCRTWPGGKTRPARSSSGRHGGTAADRTGRHVSNSPQPNGLHAIFSGGHGRPSRYGYARVASRSAPIRRICRRLDGRAFRWKWREVGFRTRTGPTCQRYPCIYARIPLTIPLHL
jgi:uncharacterized protein YegP (UPF0339 family)